MQNVELLIRKNASNMQNVELFIQDMLSALATIHDTLRMTAMAGDSWWGGRSADGAEGDQHASAEEEDWYADSDEEQLHNYE